MISKKIINYYLKGNSISATAYQFNIKAYQVYRLLKNTNKGRTRTEASVISKHKSSEKRFKFNPKVFDKMGPKEAYFLGLYYSDGCVCATTGGRHAVTICSVDRDLIEGIKIFFESTNKIKEMKKEIGKNAYTLSFSSKYLFDRLVELGCVEKKSRIIKSPNIPESLYLPFLLGVFDGDGSLSRNSSINSWKASIGTASKSFHRWLRLISDDLNLIYSFEKRKTKNGPFYNIVFTGISAKAFLSKLYGSVEGFVPLSRKKNLYEHMCTFEFTHNPRYTAWELKILRKKTTHKKCAELLNSNINNYGWQRTEDSISYKRKSLQSI